MKISIKMSSPLLFVTLLMLVSVDISAGTIDLNDFYTVDPEVVVATDGNSATMTESTDVSFVSLINDPYFGDPLVIIPTATNALSFGYDFNEGVSDDDMFTAVLFDSDVGLFGGVLQTFELFASATGTAVFELSSYLGFTLGLYFELYDLDSYAGHYGSSVTISNLALNEPLPTGDKPPVPVPEPSTIWLLGSALLGLGLRSKKFLR